MCFESTKKEQMYAEILRQGLGIPIEAMSEALEPNKAFYR